MIGRRGKNLRSGDLKEELGILLLKGFCVVASVPRPEDVGLDGVATLLREENGLLYAGNSFYVQFKSNLIRQLRYEGEEVTWLKNLKLPLFIGSVDSKTASIELYCTHRLHQILAEMHHPIIQLNLGSVPDTAAPPGERFAEIGPPVLRWSLQKMAEEGFGDWAYERMKPLVEAEQRNVDSRYLRHVDVIKWDTNEIPNHGQAQMLMQHPDDIPEILRRMRPQIFALLSHCGMSKDVSQYDFGLRLIEFSRNHGYDPDVRNSYVVTYSLLRSLELQSGITGSGVTGTGNVARSSEEE